MRITTILGFAAINVTADCSSENSAYASSTTKRPGHVFARLRISAIESEFPVGLLGVVIKVRDGALSPISFLATSISSEKSSRREPLRHSHPITRAIKGCIEYEGVNPIAPDLPNARKSDWIISLLPLAAQIFSAEKVVED
ncbi:unannotated protein [freshwater metagenome]|uniref:Unannotated protein n=1 Tax=freshwater metagenome TaxID=449393 RepID=A0A6J6DEG1_9ZZZZ